MAALIGVRLAVVVSAVCAATVVAQDEHEFQFSRVANNEIAWSCQGAGEPTIALIAGGGLSAHDSFGRTYHSYDGRGRVCMYDRAAHEDWMPRLEAEMISADWAIMKSVLDWNTRTFHEDYVQAQEAVRGARFPADLPLTVVARGVPHTQIRVARMSYAGVDLYENEHRALQPTLAELSTNAEYRVAPYSSHMFDQYDPWLVIDEIKALLKRVESVR